MYTSLFADLFPDFFQRQYGEPLKKKVSPIEVAMIILILEAISIIVIKLVITILKLIIYILSALLWLLSVLLWFLFSSLQNALYLGLMLGVSALVFFFIIGVIVSYVEKNAAAEVQKEVLDSAKESSRTDVVMPSGRSVSFPVPAKQCNCQKYSETSLVNLEADDSKSGGEYRIIAEEMNNTIKKHLSGKFSSYDIVSIHRVQNCCLWKKFRNRQCDISKEGCRINQRMLFHGTSTADDIMKRGFDERHSNPNGMFGAGVYFAEHSSKSNQYVYGYMGGNGCQQHQDRNCFLCERKMLLCRVSLGKTHQLTAANKMSHPPPGYHSVAGVPTRPSHMTLLGILTGGGLQYPEYIIYRGEQAYPEYLIRYKIVI